MGNSRSTESGISVSAETEITPKETIRFRPKSETETESAYDLSSYPRVRMWTWINLNLACWTIFQYSTFESGVVTWSAGGFCDDLAHRRPQRLVLRRLYRSPCDKSIDDLLIQTLFDAVAYRVQATGLCHIQYIQLYLVRCRLFWSTPISGFSSWHYTTIKLNTL